MSTIKMNVIVHKANLPISTNETVEEFMKKLRNAGGDHLLKKMNMTRKTADAWIVETYSDKVVFSLYEFNKSGPYKYHAFSYTRSDNGDFEFGKTYEVERVTIYKPKEQIVGKAVWTTAFINDLPDAAFAIILSGGKKDKDGKTVPRSLRMLPHHNANVESPTENNSVDITHLKNALARVDQSKMSASDKKKAKSHIQAHAKELLKTYQTKKQMFGDWIETKKSFWGGVL